MTREEAIAEIEKYENIFVRLLVVLEKTKESNDEWLFRTAEDIMPMIEMFVKGVPFIGLGIKRVREEQGLSLADMEEMTGIDRVTLRRYETTSKYIPYEDTEKIRKALNVSKHYIIEMNDRKDYESQNSR